MEDEAIRIGVGVYQIAEILEEPESPLKLGYRFSATC